MQFKVKILQPIFMLGTLLRYNRYMKKKKQFCNQHRQEINIGHVNNLKKCVHMFMFMFMCMFTHKHDNFQIIYMAYINLISMLVSELFLFFLYLL